MATLLWHEGEKKNREEKKIVKIRQKNDKNMTSKNLNLNPPRGLPFLYLFLCFSSSSSSSSFAYALGTTGAGAVQPGKTTAMEAVFKDHSEASYAQLPLLNLYHYTIRATTAFLGLLMWQLIGAALRFCLIPPPFNGNVPPDLSGIFDSFCSST